MKKNFLSFVVTICLVIPCMFGFVACGSHDHDFNQEWTINETNHWHQCKQCDEKKNYEEHNWDNGVITTLATPTTDGVKLFVCDDCKITKTEVVTYVPTTTISQTDWVNALKFNERENFQFTHEIGEMIMTIYKDGDIVYQTNNQQEVNEYQSKESDKYYAYNNDSGNWVKTEISEDDYNLTLAGIDLSALNYSEFTYNSELKAYESETMFAFTDAKLYFEDGKIVKVTAIYNNIFPFTYKIGYESIDLELPIIE